MDSRKEPVKHRCWTPSPRLTYNLTKLTAIALVWLSILSLLNVEALPGSNFWGLCIVIMGSMIGEEVAKKLRLPGLLGMIVAGFILQNVPYINVAHYIKSGWSSALRSIAVVIIVLRAGLGLDLVVLRRMSRSILLLAFVPATVESCVGAVAAHYILGMEWIWAFCLGFILCGVSPAVLIPSMLQLNEEGLGVEKGVPTLLIASSSLENVFCIQMFSILMSVGFATSSLTMQILQAPIEVVISVAYGGVLGVLFWYIPSGVHKDKVGYRFILLLATGMTAVFGGNVLKYPGAGPLSCLIVSFVAAYKWRQIDPAGHKLVADMFAKLWKYYQPVLFGLIGAAVSISNIDGSSAALGVAVIVIGAAVRLVVTGVVTQCSGFSWKERVFTMTSWFPKATVQAALGSKILDFVNAQAPTVLITATTVPSTTTRGAPAEYDIFEYRVPEEMTGHTDQLQTVRSVGNVILTLAVFVIILTAPIGALGITITKNWLLERIRINGSSDRFAIPPTISRAVFEKTVDVSREDEVNAAGATVVAVDFTQRSLEPIQL